MLLSQEFRDKIKISDMVYIVINHLEEFDKCPERIIAILERFSKLRDTPYCTFEAYFDKAYNEFYCAHNKFPDAKWLVTKLPNLDFKIERGNYSDYIYEDLIKSLDQEVARKIVEKVIVDKQDFGDEEIDKAMEVLTNYKNKNVEIKRLTADEIDNLCEATEDEDRGIETGIKELDEVVISLPPKAISLVNSPSGGGKTTLASTIMYNTAVLSGAHVIYVTFEATEKEIRYNVYSIESTYLGINRPQSDWKNKIGNKEERFEDYRKCSKSVRKQLNEKGGYINIVDFAVLPETSFEDFCLRLEKESERVGKRAELIVIDNVDGLGLFKSGTGYDRDFMSAMNKKIEYLDKFSKTYCNNAGTHIMILSQTNREGMGILEDNEDTGSETNPLANTKTRR